MPVLPCQISFLVTRQLLRGGGGRQLIHTLRWASSRTPFEADDQSALVYLLNKHNETLKERVYLEWAYRLHGYWEHLVDKAFNFGDNQILRGIGLQHANLTSWQVKPLPGVASAAGEAQPAALQSQKKKAK
eukprot:jgi/Mesen1/10353/ME000008S10131